MWRDVAGGGGGRGGVGAGPRARLGAGGRRVGGIDEVSLIISPLLHAWHSNVAVHAGKTV